MILPTRQDEMNKIIESFLHDKPELKQALDLFNIGQNEYSIALSSMQKSKIVCSDHAFLGGKENDELARH